MLHEDRARAGSFGADAERYDRGRPGYPPELVDDLLDGAPAGARVLDVGCGTGLAGRAFAARGCAVLGVEPDARMAAVARRHGLEVEVARFEAWEPAGRRFDLAVCAQAWHWIEPGRGARRLGQALAPGGTAGLSWTIGRPVSAAAEALEAVYARLEPQLRDRSHTRATWLEREPSAVRALADEGSFAAPVVRSWEREGRVTVEAWVQRLQTFSDHRLLPGDRRARLLDAVGAALRDLGGTVPLVVETRLVRAVRR